jgi:hypothetical protein
MGDDYCYGHWPTTVAYENSDQCPTSSNFDETNAEFLWLQPPPSPVHEIQFLLFLKIPISFLLKNSRKHII